MIIILISATSNIHARDDPETKLLTKFHTITSEEIMTWMEKLCSPEFQGRLSGTPEYIASAEWVAENLKEWGIKPGGDNGTYFQWFDSPYTVLEDIGSLALKISQPDGSSKVYYHLPGDDPEN